MSKVLYNTIFLLYLGTENQILPDPQVLLSVSWPKGAQGNRAHSHHEDHQGGEVKVNIITKNI